MDATRFGLFVAEMRKENHMTQAELATKIKVTDKAVSRWERGGSLHGGVAYRLFLWGFPKGATPPFGTRLCEAKCSVLYALSALL